MSKPSKLMVAAAEAHEEAFVDHDIQPVTAPTLDEGGSIFSQEEGYVLAAEALIDRARSLESLLSELDKVPESKATPEIAQTILATLMVDTEPAIASERASPEIEDAAVKDITDADIKRPGAWDATKSKVSQAAKTTAEAARRVLQMLLDFLQSVFDWIVTSRRSILKELETQRAAIASGPQATNVTYNNRMKALTYGDAFSADTAKSTMGRYATLLAACTYALQDLVGFTGNLNKVTFKPEALSSFSNYFVKRTTGALDWRNRVGEKPSAQVLDGEGGQNVKITIGTFGRSSLAFGVDVDAESIDSTAPTSENSFTRADMSEINKRGIALMKGVAACEPEIKKMSSALKGLAGADVLIRALSQGAAGVNLNGTSPTILLMNVRSYLAFANKYGVGAAVNGAAAAARLGRAYLAGNAAPAGGADQSGATGEIEARQLGYAG